MTRENDDPGERSRVYSKIAPIILDFARQNAGRLFHVEDLRVHVLQSAPDIAPDSPGRILRLLRQQGKLNYRVIDRRDSLYLFISARAAA